MKKFIEVSRVFDAVEFVVGRVRVQLIDYLSSTLHLSNLMDAHYGVGQWKERTAPGNGTDIGPALTDGLNKLRASFLKGGKIHIPPGAWQLVNPPPGDLMSGCTIKGDTCQSSLIFYNKGTGAAFTFTGNNLKTGGRLKHLGIILEPGFGRSNAYAVMLRGNATYQPDQMEFDQLYITCQDKGSYWYEGFHCNGSEREGFHCNDSERKAANAAGKPKKPQGIRGTTLRNVQVFNCHNAAGYFANCVNTLLDNFSTNVPSPPEKGIESTGADVYVTCFTTLFKGHVYINGALRLKDCHEVWIDGKAAKVIADNSATYIHGSMDAALVGSLGAGSTLVVKP
jgi:hypothetical protein